ncbi:sensor histidine kinase [Streptomyces sp. NPDC090022]|uniref:sensor histidine kinase n=1 Tax=Streptomyces sp. NPDC090022 TaxID=3365920 RepID=UPI00381914FD
MRRAVDGGIVLVVGASGCVAGHQYHPAGWEPFDAWAYLLTCLTALPLAFRRSAPATVLLASGTAYTTYLAVGYQPSVNWWGPALALVGVVALRPPRVSAGAVVLTMAMVVHSGIAGRLPAALVAAQAALVPGFAVVVGYTQRRLARQNAELRRLSAQLAHEQAERARRAVVDERVRIARELHDVVAHHMSVVSVQAGLASYVFVSDAATARSALGAATAASREALEEMRRMLGVLRVDGPGEHGEAAGDRDPPPTAPLPGLDGLGRLIERMPAADVTVELRTAGRRRRLAPGLDLCAYRVIQEALTNVVKHAAPTRAQVELAYLPDALHVTVRDSGRAAGSPPGPAVPVPGSGYGLIGMRERASLCGGSLTAGARREGGFEVRLSLPTHTVGPPDPPE